MSLVVAVDVGGTTIKSALIDSSFNIISTATAPTPNADTTGQETVHAIANLVDDLAAKNRSIKIESIGLAVPGALDEINGKSRWAGNLKWKDLPIRDLLHDELNLPIAFGHDVRTGALAELRLGAAKGKNDAIFIPIGTGIAAALIIDGAIRSANGFAGEIGHLNVGHAYRCVCGKDGCLEAISSALAISTAYAKQSNKHGRSAEDVVALAKNGDVLASKIWNEALVAMAKACEILITILAPEVIVFGGGVSSAGAALIDPISNSLDQLLTFQQKPELKIAHFGAQAGIIGCAMIAFDLLAEAV